jgi:hypothetical protein
MASSYNPSAWTTFFSAQVGASAALAGLIFVAVSINLARIAEERLLVARAAKALFTFTGVLLVATLSLIPAQPANWLGAELIAAGIPLWIAISRSQWKASHKNPYVTLGQKIVHSLLAQSSAVPFVAGGVSLVLGRGGGLYWLAAGTSLAIVAGLIDAWVLLIEVHR